MISLWSALKKLLWESLADKSYHYLENLPKHCIFTDILLIVSYIKDALRKELLVASFVELFKNANLVKSY